MKIFRETDGPVALLTCEHEQEDEARGANITPVRNEVSRLVEEGCSLIVLDLSRIDFINSSGIGALVGSLRCVQQRNGALILTGLTLKVAETLAVVRMLNVIPVRLTRQEAALVLRKAKPEKGLVPKLLAGNPSLGDVHNWWDSVLNARASGVVGKLPTPPTTEPPVGSLPAAEVALPTPLLASLSEAPAVKTQAPQPAPDAGTPPPKDDWAQALEVVRQAAELAARSGVEFREGLTFGQLLFAVANAECRRGSQGATD